MSGGFPVELILVAMVAAFLVLRLRSVLGRRTGFERPPQQEGRATNFDPRGATRPADAAGPEAVPPPAGGRTSRILPDPRSPAGPGARAHRPGRSRLRPARPSSTARRRPSA